MGEAFSVPENKLISRPKNVGATGVEDVGHADGMLSSCAHRDVIETTIDCRAWLGIIVAGRGKGRTLRRIQSTNPHICEASDIAFVEYL